MLILSYYMWYYCNKYKWDIKCITDIWMKLFTYANSFFIYINQNTHVYVCMYVCMYVCICIYRERERDGEGDNKSLYITVKSITSVVSPGSTGGGHRISQSTTSHSLCKWAQNL